MVSCCRFLLTPGLTPGTLQRPRQSGSAIRVRGSLLLTRHQLFLGYILA